MKGRVLVIAGSDSGGGAGANPSDVGDFLNALQSSRVADCSAAAWRLAGRAEEPPLTRFVAAQLSTSHSYDLEPLEQDLGWR